MFCCSDESVVYISLGSLGTVQKEEGSIRSSQFLTPGFQFAWLLYFFMFAASVFFRKNGSFENCA